MIDDRWSITDYSLDCSLFYCLFSSFLTAAVDNGISVST